MKKMMFLMRKVLFYKRKRGENHPVGKGPGRVLWNGGASVEEGPTRLRVVESGVGRPGREEPGVVRPGVEGPGVPGAEMVGKETVPVVPLVVKLKVRRSLRRLLILVLTFQMKSILSLPLPHGVNLGGGRKRVSTYCAAPQCQPNLNCFRNWHFFL